MEETTWEGLAVFVAWSAGQQQVSLAFLTFRGSMTAGMQDLHAMLCFLSSLWDATEGYLLFHILGFVYGEGKELFFFFYCLLETLQAAFFPFILSYKKHKVAITISQENKGLRRWGACPGSHGQDLNRDLAGSEVFLWAVERSLPSEATPPERLCLDNHRETSSPN